MSILKTSSVGQAIVDRRRFLNCLAAAGASGWLASWARAEEKRLATPDQTTGPYYPIPAINKQKHNDSDLTRKLGKDQVAKGEPIIVKGRVVNAKGAPLSGAVVEVWQASTDGRYNHPRDTNPTPLDSDFQYWGRMVADHEGKYEFKTIKPGEYPGRTPHIHYKVTAAKHRDLATQLYFADEAKNNARDGIYKRLNRQERKAVTTELAKSSDHPKWKVGRFELVLRSKG